MIAERDITAAQARADPMVEVGSTGLKRWASAGTIEEEYDPNLQGTRGLRVYQEMSESDPTIGAILFAIEQAIRDVEWTAVPGGETDADKQAAGFIESCQRDMSHTWNDLISEILSMLTYGWAAFEIVYKKRLGLSGDAESAYDDGAIGWRKIAIRSQDSLSRWIWDSGGGVQALEQLPPPDFQYRAIPIEKLLLFTTRRRKGNPEGRSVLRPAYKSWYYRKNLEVLEAIALERQGAGYPVWTLPQGASSGTDSDTDESRVKKVLRNLRLDQEAGVIEPFGHKFRWETPGGRVEQFGEAILRHKKDIAMSVLAEFILLGMDKGGSYALVRGKKEFFQLALGGWVGGIAEVFDRYAIPRLLRLNPQMLRGITAYPRIAYTEPGTVDLAAVAEFVERVSAAGLLTPDDATESWLRALARMPERMKPAEEKPAPSGDVEQPNARRYAQPDLREPGRKWEDATNAYQKALVKGYDDWAAETIQALKRGQRDKVSVEHLQRILDGRLQELAVDMKVLGRTRLQEAYQIGLGSDREPTAGQLTQVRRKAEENDKFVDESLIPDARLKLSAVIAGELLADDTAARDAFDALRSRQAQYAGAYWNTIITASGVKRREREEAAKNAGEKPRRIRWVLDPHAQHCHAGPSTHGCLQLGGRTWASWDDLPTLPAGNVTCRGGCRCSLEEEQPDGSWKRLA